MPFVNEIVSDADIDAYGLEFKKGGEYWWTRDKERDLYLWGGCTDFASFGEFTEGRFFLLVDGVQLEISVLKGTWSQNWHVKPYIIVWDEIRWIRPSDFGGITKERVVEVLKEALVAYGRDGELNLNVPERIVSFGF
jgi:hypothetical protein